MDRRLLVCYFSTLRLRWQFTRTVRASHCYSYLSGIFGSVSMDQEFDQKQIRKDLGHSRLK